MSKLECALADGQVRPFAQPPATQALAEARQAALTASDVFTRPTAS